MQILFFIVILFFLPAELFAQAGQLNVDLDSFLNPQGFSTTLNLLLSFSFLHFSSEAGVYKV